MVPAIHSIDDAALAALVSAAQVRVVFVAPGVSTALANALAAAWHRLGPKRMSVVLDADAGACRLGYGSEEGLKLLHETGANLGTMVCHQPGLRVGVVVTERETLIFTPTPLLIEAGCKPGSGANAITLCGAPPVELARDLGIGPSGVADQAIGLDSVTQTLINGLSVDLKRNPPLPFDISRQVMVFNSKLEFVEFSVAKIQLQRIDIPIPPDLTGFEQAELRTLFRFDPGKELTDAKLALEKKKQALDSEYTRPAKGFSGSLIERTRKDEFLKKVEAFKTELEAFRTFVQHNFDEVAVRNQKRLHEILMPVILRTPPDGWAPRAGSAKEREAAIGIRLERELKALFKKTQDDLVSGMRVSVLFKGVTYECLTSREFIKIAHSAFPHLDLLHEEYQAAPEGAKPAMASTG